MFRPLWEAMLDAAEVRKETKYLDLGCGSGGASVLAAGRGAEVSGLDASEKLLEIARERLPDGDFREGEIESLPYGDDEFDVVFAANSIQFLDDRARALAGIRRAMSPRAKFVVGMWCEPERTEMSAMFKALMELSPLPPDAPPTLTIRENLAGMLESNGLRIDKEGEVLCPFEFESVDDFVESNTSPGLVVGIAREVGEDTVREAIRRAIAPLARKDGSISLSNWFRYMVCA